VKLGRESGATFVSPMKLYVSNGSALMKVFFSGNIGDGHAAIDSAINRAERKSPACEDGSPA
jgi:hypothetical protein